MNNNTEKNKKKKKKSNYLLISWRREYEVYEISICIEKTGE